MRSVSRSLPCLGRRPVLPKRFTVRICKVYKFSRHKLDKTWDQETQKDDDEMPDIEQLSPGGAWNISPKEWTVIKRVADQLFPEGQMDWEQFWSRDDYIFWYPGWRFFLEKEGGLDPALPQYEPSVNGQRMWLMKAMKYLETRHDYCESMPYDWAAENELTETPETTDAKEFDPDWDDWDWRAAMEKRRARERGRREWRREQQEQLGKYDYVDTISLDMRIPDEVREGYEWTEEEFWDIITQKGRAFDPRKEKGPWMEKGPWREMNPDELPDWAAEGNQYVEEIDEYMLNTGRMVDSKAYFEKENARLAQTPYSEDVKEAFEDAFENEDAFRDTDEDTDAVQTKETNV